MAQWALAAALPWVARALLVGCLCCGCGAHDEGGEQAAPAAGQDDARTVAQGRELFVRTGCPVCHGDEGHGDGRIADTLRPRPRDFRNTASYKQGTGVAAIALTLEKGVQDGTGMPAYPHLSGQERQLLATYVRYLSTRQ